MTCDHSPPYAFILGYGPSNAVPFAFRGEVIIQQSTGTVARIQIGSDDITPCSLQVSVLTIDTSGACW